MIDASLHLLQSFGFAAIAVDLRPAGDARGYLVAQHVALDHLPVHLVVSHGMWSWPNYTHTPLQDVEELRQFIK